MPGGEPGGAPGGPPGQGFPESPEPWRHGGAEGGQCAEPTHRGQGPKPRGGTRFPPLGPYLTSLVKGAHVGKPRPRTEPGGHDHRWTICGENLGAINVDRVSREERLVTNNLQFISTKCHETVTDESVSLLHRDRGSRGRVWAPRLRDEGRRQGETSGQTQSHLQASLPSSLAVPHQKDFSLFLIDGKVFCENPK